MPPKCTNDTVDEESLYLSLERLAVDSKTCFCDIYSKTRRTQGADLASIDKLSPVVLALLEHSPKGLPPYAILARVATRLNAHFHWGLSSTKVNDGADRWKLILRHLRDAAKNMANKKGKARLVPFESVAKMLKIIQLTDEALQQSKNSDPGLKDIGLV